MSKLSWNEIRQRAIQFSRSWDGVTSERAEAQSFWNELFEVFGLKRRVVASFEELVKSIRVDGHYQRIDIFWKGRLLAEHKSAGESLDKAHLQAFEYIQSLHGLGRTDEVPRYVVVSDFQRFILYDLEPDSQEDLPLFRGQKMQALEFSLADLHRHVKDFAFLIGQKTHRFGEEDPANLEAAQLMADLHDAVEVSGYTGSDLERLLVRLLFCLFADDTGIFETNQFELFIENNSREDGSDLGNLLLAFFDTLNRPAEKRQRQLDEELAAFPYINGELFADHLPLVALNRDMRNRILAACRFDWSRISPAVFGSLFQGIMDAKERRQIGAHYTSERDILKLIRPLFLDALRDEFEHIRSLQKGRQRRLDEFQGKLASLNFLDPACGCGNFLVIAYRELRRLELELLKLRYPTAIEQQELPQGEVVKLSKVDVNQFYGIEIEEWPTRIAETALWLTDHQMNNELSLAFGNPFMRIPLTASPHIRCANALRIDWNDLLPAKECTYVMGNPPFVGKKEQDVRQKQDHDSIWDGTKGAGILDYVTCWYVKAGQYADKMPIQCAFVSTNSISQGEQVGVLWSRLFSEFSFKITFAHRTFAWQSEARGAAHVHVVIIGFSRETNGQKRLFVYDHPKGEPILAMATNINPYLTDAPDVVIRNRTAPFSLVPAISYGSMMIDKARKSGPDEGLVLAPEEAKILKAACPAIKPYIRRFYGGDEFINGLERWCLWLVDAPPSLIRACEPLRARIDKVRQFRLSSNREATKKLAATPYLFGEIRQPSARYLLIPKVSSETRHYLPIGFMRPSAIASGSTLTMPGATNYHFGVLASALHMAWLTHVGGRLESRLQYSSNIVYNNFPWPPAPTPEQRAKVEACAQAVLDARQGHLDAGSTLADLYDPNTMPVGLLKAHQALDKAVDRCYRAAAFTSERERVEYLFGLYEQLTAPLAVSASPASKKRTKRGG